MAASVWLKHLLRWHWVSSALALFGLLLFVITGVTLNHAGQIPGTPMVTVVEGIAPDAVLASVVEAQKADSAVLPIALNRWLQREQGLALKPGAVEWSEYELYVSLPKPGGDAWLSLDLNTGELLYETTDRGWIAWLNDLHKGRNAGPVWFWFIDVFAVICLVFCLTGLAVLGLHARERISVWPVVGLGVLLPLLLAVVFVH
jgi:hypothetical protein